MGKWSISRSSKWIILFVLICFTTAMIFSNVFIKPVCAGIYGTRKITDNDYNDDDHRIDNGVIVWRWWDTTDSDYEISFYDVSSETTRRITNNAYSDYDPQIDGGVVVWRGYDGSDYEIYSYDISSETTRRITNNAISDYDPQIDGDVIVWRWWDGFDYEISLYDISSGVTTRITNNAYDDYDPQIDGDVIVWRWWDTTHSDYEISFYEISSGTTTKITDNAYSDYGHQIDGGVVVWRGYDGSDYEIFLYEISSGTTTQITDNTYSDYDPQIDGGVVVWRASDIVGADYEIFLYDISSGTTTQITDNTYSDYGHQIDGGVVVWRGYDQTANYEIFLYDVSSGTTTQVTNNTYADDIPQIDGGVVVWRGYDGSDYEIFLAMVDITPPLTTVSQSGTPGDNAWWTSDVTVTLDTTELETPGGPTYYRLDVGATWTTYTTSFTITTEGTTTLQYYSVDQADPPNYETIKNETIKIDKTSPTGSITINEGASSTKSASVTLALSATDATSGAAQMRFSDDNSTWTPWEAYATSKSWSLPDGDGTKTVYVQFMDSAGLISQLFQDSIVFNTSPIGGPGYLEEALIGVAIAAIAVGVVLYKLRKRPKKPPAATQLRIQAEPEKIIADGESKSTITIQLLDKKGKPIAASEDTQVKLTTTGGKIERPVVRILKGEETGKTVLVSSKESGTIDLSAEAKGLESTAIKLEFEEKPRFCMGCGTRMSVTDKKCKKCGAAPEQFTGPAKICKNCERMGKTTYIPQTADFCSECGASQPK